MARVFGVTSHIFDGSSAREAVPGCTPAMRATSLSVAPPGLVDPSRLPFIVVIAA